MGDLKIIVEEVHIQSAFEQIHQGNMEKVMAQFSTEQRALLTYIFLMQEKLEFEDDFELLLLLSTSIWLSFKAAFENFPSITEDKLMEVANGYMEKLKAEEAPLSGEHPQMELLAFAEQMIKNHMEDRPEMDLKSQSIVMTTAHIVVDALHQTIN
ncbi:hypothetical protein [Persicobacter diffluens]|uniref:Uncharacterized protein n=1 Tax=Persicobacter diffluens TaxID=981 RepID=A0AAN4W1X9_9BACT|nr:hypothetical protein PEDI_29720 [Persicobacter diffluens]